MSGMHWTKPTFQHDETEKPFTHRAGKQTVTLWASPTPPCTHPPPTPGPAHSGRHRPSKRLSAAVLCSLRLIAALQRGEISTSSNTLVAFPRPPTLAADCSFNHLQGFHFWGHIVCKKTGEKKKLLIDWFYFILFFVAIKRSPCDLKSQSLLCIHAAAPSDWCLCLQTGQSVLLCGNNRWADEVRPEFSQRPDSAINCLSYFIWCLGLITAEVMGIRSGQGQIFSSFSSETLAHSPSHTFFCPPWPDSW